MDLISQARGDLSYLSSGSPTPVMRQSWLERKPAGQVRTEQVAPVSLRNSVFLPGASRVTWGSTGVMRMDRVESGAGQVLRPYLLVCRNLSSKRSAWNWDWLRLPLKCPQEDTWESLPSQCPSFWQKAPWGQNQAASWWSVQASQPSRAPLRWWVKQNRQKLCFLY